MKKIFIVIFFYSFSLVAQENNVWLFQMHEMEVSGNVNEFVKDQKEFYMKLASHGVKKGEWAGWSCFRSITSPNKFIFIHHFNSVKQRVNPQIWTQSNVDELGLKWPENTNYTAKTTKPIYIYQAINSVQEQDEPSKFWRLNYHKFQNLQNYIKLQNSWGDMVVKKSQKNIKAMNWGFGIVRSNEDGDIYNGISFDGYDSLDQMLESQLYIPNQEGDPNVAKWWNKIQKEDFAGSIKDGKRELFRVVAETFN